MKKLTKLTLVFCSFLPASVFAALGESALTENKDATFGEFLTRIQNWLLGITGGLAVLFIVYGGFLYVTSGGNKERVETAKKTLTYAIIGLLLVILAGVIFGILTGNLLTGIFGSDTLKF